MSDPTLLSKDSLLPCPFCGGDVMFCSDTNHTCHLVICTSCSTSVDLAIAADPSGDCERLEDLQHHIAKLWNKRVNA